MCWFIDDAAFLAHYDKKSHRLDNKNTFTTSLLICRFKSRRKQMITDL